MTQEERGPAAGRGPTTEGSGPGHASAGPAGATASGHRMARDRRHKMIAGVCAGLGRHFDLDPVIFRVSLAVLSVIGGLGFIAYGVAWLMLPFADEEENEARRMFSGRVEGPGLTALLFTLVGFGLLLASLGSRSQWFSVMLLGTLAAAAYWSQHRRRTQAAEAEGIPVDTGTAQAVADAPPEATAPPAPGGPSWWRESSVNDRAGGGYLWGPADAAPGEYRLRTGVGVEQRGPAGRRGQAERPGGRRERREPWLGGPVLLIAVAAAVLGTALAWDRQPLGAALVIGLSAALAVFGAGLVVGAFVGRMGSGTVVAVVLTGGLLAGAAMLPDTVTTDWRDTVWRPADVSQVQPVYELGTGRGVLDLGALELGAEDTVSLTADLGAGMLTVRVPHDARVELAAQLGAGAYGHFESAGDFEAVDAGAGLGLDHSVVLLPPRGVQEGATVRLTARVGVGYLQIERAQAPAFDDPAPGSAGEDGAGETTEEGP
ncbi:PspC domain-containing protein [Streptomyces sodiiphilus]|uniref:PspC domain-containing protein n=1 Tax=Streptomyces sodiiphilus TaxID=226217 RepID=A0ABN2PGV1_9ACTN